MYKALCFFTDLKDHEHAYHAGDVFPRRGMTVSEERIKELASCNNRRGVPVIEEVIVKEHTKETISEAKEEPREVKTDVDTPKRTKTKKSTRKTQE